MQPRRAARRDVPSAWHEHPHAKGARQALAAPDGAVFVLAAA